MDIDLNADLAEGYGDWRIGDDDALLGVLARLARAIRDAIGEGGGRVVPLSRQVAGGHDA